MTTPVEKRNASKFCKFHREVGHTTDECMHLKKQIEEMLKAGKLSHLIKELKKAADKNLAIQEEVRKLVEAGIMKEVHYHDWLSNPVMVKKHDDRWRMYAFKGYHQIQMAKEDEEKTVFITSQGIFCYTKMPFGLRNAGATYQRLVDKAFHKQIGRNLEVYVDDLVIKSRMEDEIFRDIEETFKTLRFLAKSAEKSLPFFKTLKKCMKKSDFHWTTEAEEAFKQMKQLIAELPMLTAPMEKEELIVYLAAAKETILADFIVERPEEDSLDNQMEVEEELPEPWILFTDGSSYIDGSGAGLILTNPEGMEFTYALRFRFDATNNEAEYEALIVELRIAEQMGVKNLQANVDSRLVANQVNETYVAKEADMIRYLEKMTPIFKYLAEGILPADVKKARAIRGPLQANYVLREIHEGSCSMHAGTRSIVAKALRTGYYWPTMHKDARTFRLPGEIISDNGRQFQDDPFKDWCEKLCIRQHFTSVKHPQTNGLVERANRSFGEGMKARLDARSKNWMEELSHVLWAHSTMIKSSNGDTPFSLTYGTEAVIPAEISMPTLRTAEVDLVQNNEAFFKPGDLVYHNNDASRAEDTGNLGPKWEGPYEVTKALGKGAYKLRDRDRKQLSWT
ncbi:reverse transcriptase domain-containing protein [Tanacetum coccineum]